MPLIRAKDKTNDYAVMVGANINNGTASSVLLQFCTSFLSSQGITRINNTSVSVSENGRYEIKFPLTYSSANSLTFFVDIGINGVYTQISSQPTNGTYNPGYYNYIMDLVTGDVITIRCRLSASSANFITNASLTRRGLAVNNSVNGTSTIKRL
jgi:hypothetical protein